MMIAGARQLATAFLVLLLIVGCAMRSVSTDSPLEVLQELPAQAWLGE